MLYMVLKPISDTQCSSEISCLSHRNVYRLMYHWVAFNLLRYIYCLGSGCSSSIKGTWYSLRRGVCHELLNLWILIFKFNDWQINEKSTLGSCYIERILLLNYLEPACDLYAKTPLKTMRFLPFVRAIPLFPLDPWFLRYIYYPNKSVHFMLGYWSLRMKFRTLGGYTKVIPGVIATQKSNV